MLKKIQQLSLIAIFLTNNAYSDSSVSRYLEEKVDSKIASAVCDDLSVIDVDGILACEMCPSFIVRALSEPLVLHNMVIGKFSSADAREIIVDTEGCEPHSNNFGGMVLLEKKGQDLLTRYYQPGFRLHDCLKFESLKERDILVCNQIYQGQGSTIGQFAAFRFGEHKATWQELQSWIYSEENEYFIKPGVAVKVDINKDGIKDLKLIFKIKSSNTSSKTITINYLFDGKEFKLLSGSEEGKKEIDKLYKILN